MLPLEQGSISSVTEFSAHLLVILCFVHKEFIFPAQSNTIITVCSLHPNSLLCSQHPARKPAAGWAGRDAFTAPCWDSGQWKFHFSVNPHIPSGQGGSCWAPALLGRVGLDYFSRAGWFSACATGFLHFWQAQVSQRLSNSLCAPCKTLPCCPERGLKPGTRGATPNPESKDIYLRPRVKHQLITQCFCNLFLDINAWV